MLIWVWGGNTLKAVQKEYEPKGEDSVKIACLLKIRDLVEAVTSLQILNNTLVCLGIPQA